MRPQADQNELVWASRFATIVAMILAAVVTVFMDSVGAAWAYILTFTAGVGLVMILRWYWWRINAWTEISALVTSGLVASILQAPGVTLVPEGPNKTVIVLLITVAITTVVWISVTFLTKPEPYETLAAFYRKVQPSPFGWKPIAERVGLINEGMKLSLNILDWIAGCGLVYFTLFGIGKVVLAETATGILLLLCAAICLAFIFWDMNRRDWESADSGAGVRGAMAATTAVVALATLALWPAHAHATPLKEAARITEPGSASILQKGSLKP